MHIEQLVTMANDIAAFFHGASEPDAAPRSIADHLRRFWDPRMRKQIIEYYHAGGSGLSELARAGVALLATAPSAPAGSSMESG
jgi:formate dehydrogenase subunit delta